MEGFGGNITVIVAEPSREEVSFGTRKMGEEVEEEPDIAVENNPSHHEEQPQTWSPIRFDVPPQRTLHFCRQFRTSPNPNNFLKAVKWCFLSQTFLNILFFSSIFFLGLLLLIFLISKVSGWFVFSY